MILETMSFKELEYYIINNNARIIDLRAPDAFLKSHIEGAENIPFYQLERQMCRFCKKELIIFYCDRGNNSLLACRDFNRCGFYTKAVIGIFSEYRGKYLMG